MRTLDFQIINEFFKFRYFLKLIFIKVRDIDGNFIFSFYVKS
jgi:hypothetical protein